MAKAKSKTSTSVSIDEDLVGIIEDTPGVKKSTLFNDLGWEWAERNGFAD